MTVIGVALRDHGHDLSGVSFTISVHFLGMFGLVLVVGYLIDRIGRRRSMTGGLFILGAGQTQGRQRQDVRPGIPDGRHRQNSVAREAILPASYPT